MKFYNVRKRKEVEVCDCNCKKVVYERNTSKGVQKRYAVRAHDDGTNLTKFVDKETFDKLQIPLAQG